MKISKAEKLFITNLAWNHKIHEKQAEIDKLLSTRLRWGTIITTIAIFIVLVAPLEKEVGFFVKFGLALLELALVMSEWAFRPEEKFSSNKSTARQLLILLNKIILRFSDYEAGNTSHKEFKVVREEIRKDADKINQVSPQTTDKAVKIASTEVPKYLESIGLQ